ncbi:Zn(II)2Cys6 transcription factor [Aspergillus homomorphus CBS 101889]|uniref:Xylanolytic transcriptional activator regulatory domain-containing protein n=1 Tax=Aspergillus homomorphus (strain CBS 101889) TaxID=1450537 RepID=A0A395I3B3_ASPHC|nr:hypothetical protein BO97DRAFT_365992 [Aspergillus homomorphus CBS 101889]RAL14189.1 hypothetical protein BO97DRAFT_365992 [Aspergillus homomorphus CBS 101889]
MELTWLVDSPQTRSRKRALRACDRCQRRKKRCHHILMQLNPTRVRRRRLAVDLVDGQSQSRPGISTDKPLGTSVPGRFVGEMNPEVAIRERLAVGAGSASLRNRVGLWIPFSAVETGRPYLEDVANVDQRPFTHQVIEAGYTYPPQEFEGLIRRRHESALQASRPLPASTRALLFAIYFSQVHHILPTVEPDVPVTSPFLERAICLVAAKARAAAPHLYLCDNGALASPRDFCSQIYTGLKDAIFEGLKRDRITRIRVLALMALHCEDSEGSEAASMHLSQAIHLAQTIGLHLKQPSNSDRSCPHLFWSLWALDKLLVSMFGRPALIIDHDVSAERPGKLMDSAKAFKGAFEIWFSISQLLLDAIRLYRPGTETTVDLGIFPSFEEVVGSKVESLDFATLAFLELSYHAVGIVFHRTIDSTVSEQSNSAQIQRGLAATCIQSIVAKKCTHDLPPLPIISYAVSLSMSVSYRHYRSSNLITHRRRAATDIETCCTLLEGLSVSWYSAEAMARLGRKALQQIRESDPGLNRDTVPTLPSVQTTQNKRGQAAPIPSRGGEGSLSIDATCVPFAQHSVDYPHGGDQGLAFGDMADLDIAFDDFLDLSLPTNF